MLFHPLVFGIFWKKMEKCGMMNLFVNLHSNFAVMKNSVLISVLLLCSVTLSAQPNALEMSENSGIMMVIQ